MTRTKLQNRKYYLNRKVKGHCRLIATRRMMFVSAAHWDGISSKMRKYMRELRDSYGYVIQSEL